MGKITGRGENFIMNMKIITIYKVEYRINLRILILQKYPSIKIHTTGACGVSCGLRGRAYQSDLYAILFTKIVSRTFESDISSKLNSSHKSIKGIMNMYR